jgi:2-desacetyl-2-hydroxyethyl bacteriochlorophyllide A dehydrogenase
MKNLAVYFTNVEHVEVREEKTPSIHEQQVLVQTIVSAISSGTEMLFYRGLVPEEIPLDENIPVLATRSGYPFKYGYAVVGKVIESGKMVDPKWKNKLVFAFHPHQRLFAAEPANLIEVEGISTEDAVYLANMETAVNFAMDGRPLIGERILVFGQGVVGLLTTLLLTQIPLRRLLTVELHEARRKMSIECGAAACLDPQKDDFAMVTDQLLEGNRADLVYELTGNPQTLEQVIPLTAFGGRVIIGSWYGTKTDKLQLDSNFHRRRIKLISSQVSTIAPEFTGAWTKQRRLDVAREMVMRLKPSRLTTHRIPIQEADRAYRLLADSPEQAIGVTLTY